MFAYWFPVTRCTRTYSLGNAATTERVRGEAGGKWVGKCALLMNYNGEQQFRLCGTDGGGVGARTNFNATRATKVKSTRIECVCMCAKRGNFVVRGGARDAAIDIRGRGLHAIYILCVWAALAVFVLAQQCLYELRFVCVCVCVWHHTCME